MSTYILPGRIPGNEQSEGVIMKIAIAKEGEEVSGHFGHCTEYAVFDIEDNKITKKEILESPGHEPGKLPVFLAGHGVTHVIAGGMGPRAVDLFCANDIEVFLGVQGEIDTVIRDFMAGKIAQGESSCTHGPDHECSGH
jgi:predicted Fe-Mo cluster-binding NifX family protein